MPLSFPTNLVRKLTALLLLTATCQLVSAEEATVDEGERRAQSAGASLIGKLGPAAVLTTLDGEQIDLSQLYGKKPVYLKFWATWCVPCRQQMPGFEEIQQTLGDKVQVIAVNTGFSDDAEAARDYREELGLSMPIVVDDGSLATALNVRVTPMHVLIGRDGRIAHIGHLDNDQLHAALQRVIASETGTVARSSHDAAKATPTFKVGDQVQGLQASTLDQQQVKIGAGSGKAQALVFFAPWCEPYLADSQPRTSQACKRVREDVDRLAAEQDIEWLGVSSGLWTSSEDLLDYQNSNTPKLPLALDENDALFRAFGVRDIPSVVLLDAKGRVTHILGPQDRQLSEAVRAVTAR